MQHHLFVPLALALVTLAPLGVGACASTRTVGEFSDDVQTKQRVAERLENDPQVARESIDLEVRDGVVTLRGEVDDRIAADQAVQIARDTYGVARVINQLQVAPLYGEGEEPLIDGDLGIRASVGTELLADPDVRRVNIDVDVMDGVVYLSGTVHDPESRQTAEQIARNIDGVVRVENELRVSPADEPLSRDSDVMGQPAPRGAAVQGNPPQDTPPQGNPPQETPPKQNPPKQNPPKQNPPPQDKPPQDKPPQDNPPKQPPPQPDPAPDPNQPPPTGQPPAGR